jgi:hypothetical protein
MTIATLPTPPSRQDPTNFAIRADAFLGALPAFATQANALATDVNIQYTTVQAAKDLVIAKEVTVAGYLDSFDDRYLGVKTTNPTVNNDGDALLTGALYWNSTSNEMRVWSGTAWFAVQTTSAATTAGTLAANASTSASEAAASAAAAAATYDAFDDRWLGPKASDPIVDNDSNAIVVGAVYFNTTLSVMRVWTGTIWREVSSVPNGIQERNFTATSFQNTYTFVGDTYNSSLLFIYLNGTLLPASRYTATNGTLVTFTPSLTAGDLVRILTFKAAATAAIEQAVALGAINTIDLNNGDLYIKTITGNTTFAVTNVPPSGAVASFMLELVNGGSATVNWWAPIKWPGGVPPTLTGNGRDVLGFYSYDAGTTWTGFLLGSDVK